MVETIIKRIAAVLVALVAGHLLLLYLNFALWYSATVGIDQAVRESRFYGKLALLFLGLAAGLQFLAAWLLKPRGVGRFVPNLGSRMMQLPESGQPAMWERYVVRLLISVLATLALFGVIFMVAMKTSYLPTLLKLLGLA